MIKKHLFIFIFSALSLTVFSQPFSQPERGFVSWKPAPNWEDALLSGNGIMGTMVFGEPHNETVILNHAQSFLPLRVPIPPINQAALMDTIRLLLSQEKYEEAAMIPVEQSLKEGYEEKHWIDPLVPVCNLKIKMRPGNVSDYVRMVDFETGESKVQWMQNGEIFQRKSFVSRADNVIVMKISSSTTIDTEFYFRRHPVEWDQWDYINNSISSVNIGATEDYITYSTEFKQKYEPAPEGFEGVAYVYNMGGTKTKSGNSIIVKGADEIIVVMQIEPNFNISESQIPILVNRIIEKGDNYNSLLASQKEVHSKLFNSVRLNLGKDEYSNIQSEAFVLQAKENTTPSIIQKQFDAARYNIISSIGINPPTLQGIWSGTWTPPWSSGFTHDGNVVVAVSHLLSSNTHELLEAYLSYHERMMLWYRDNAKLLFGTRGISLPGHSSTHGWNVHFDNIWPLSLWSGGAGWASSVLYDYYLYTGDLKLLKDRVYPFMKEAAWFYEDFLIKDENGKYLFSPSYSPENNPANSSSQLIVNATMDVMVAKELLRNCITAGKKVGESKKQIKIWEDMLKYMPDYRINDAGELAEWIPEQFEENHSHRHLSHLYALYEIVPQEFKENKELMDAAIKAVDARMYHRRRTSGGEMVFGLAQLGMVTANLGNADFTGEIIELLSKYYWAPNLATYHNSGDLFNMDLSGGFPAVIIRSLAYSEIGEVKLLPALSPNWKQGSIEGIALRGQIVVPKLEWNENEVNVIFNSAISQTITVKLPKSISKVESNLKSVSKVNNLNGEFTLKLEKNKPTSIKIVY